MYISSYEIELISFLSLPLSLSSWPWWKLKLNSTTTAFSLKQHRREKEGKRKRWLPPTNLSLLTFLTASSIFRYSRPAASVCLSVHFWVFSPPRGHSDWLAKRWVSYKTQFFSLAKLWGPGLPGGGVSLALWTWVWWTWAPWPGQPCPRERDGWLLFNSSESLKCSSSLPISLSRSQSLTQSTSSILPSSFFLFFLSVCLLSYWLNLAIASLASWHMCVCVCWLDRWWPSSSSSIDGNMNPFSWKQRDKVPFFFDHQGPASRSGGGWWNKRGGKSGMKIGHFSSIFILFGEITRLGNWRVIKSVPQHILAISFSAFWRFFPFFLSNFASFSSSFAFID